MGDESARAREGRLPTPEAPEATEVTEVTEAGSPVSSVALGPYVTLAVLALVVWAVAVVWSLRIVLEESPAAEGGAGRQDRGVSPWHSAGVRIDLNRASAEELQALPGIGPVLSARIVQERAKGGGFSGVDGLLRVRGITKELIGRLRPFVKVERRAGRAVGGSER